MSTSSDRHIVRAVSMLEAAESGSRLSIDCEALVSEVLANLTVVAAKRHPLGFSHFDLSGLARRSDVSVRLHIWTDLTRPHADGLGYQHDHIWSLKSVALVGALADVIVEPLEDPQGTALIAEVHYGDGEDRVIPLKGRFSVSVVSRRQIDAGDVYALEERLFHETEIQLVPTATLVVARPALNARPRLLTSQQLGGGRKTPRTPISPETARFELEQVRESARRRDSGAR